MFDGGSHRDEGAARRTRHGAWVLMSLMFVCLQYLKTLIPLPCYTFHANRRRTKKKGAPTYMGSRHFMACAYDMPACLTVFGHYGHATNHAAVGLTEDDLKRKDDDY